MSKQLPKDTRPLQDLHSLIFGFFSTKGMLSLLVVSVLLVSLAAFGAWFIGPFFQEKYGDQFNPPASLEEVARQYPELANILLDPQLDSAYKDIFIAYANGGSSEAVELARRYGLIDQEDYLRLTLELDRNDSTALAEQLESGGMKVTAVSGNLVDIAIPLSLIEQAIESGDPGRIFKSIKDLDQIIHIRPPRKGMRQVSNTEGESLPVINGNEWQAQGFKGKGIKIGVLDLGFDRYRELLGIELPGRVSARSFISGMEIDQTGEEHGTAVAEVIYDIAPEAELFFAAYSTDAEQRLAVDWLVSQGVKIISHSVRSIYGPMDGSGEEARLVERTVAKQVLWVNSAGNDAESHYRGVFLDENGDGYHEFSDGDQLMSFIPAGRVRMALNWDAWVSGDQDYDLIVMDGEKNKIVSSENIQNGPGDDAAEFIEYEFWDSGPYYIAFYARQITRPAVFNFFIYEGESLEYTTAEYSISSPADSDSSLSVGATYWSDDILENYSSRGPTLDGRIKPDLSAPTGISSVTYGEPFFGTSASAPHVSAAAALVWQAHPDFTVQMVIDFLQNRSLDLGPEGEDNLYGFGRLYLGDVTEENLEPIPTALTSPEASAIPTHTASVQPPTATSLPSETVSGTASPSVTPTLTPAAYEIKSNPFLAVLILISCVVIPGVAGLSGMGLFGFIEYQNYKESKKAPIRGLVTPLNLNSNQAFPEDSDHKNVCPRCGTINRSKARYCRYCGLDLREAAALETGWTHCENCGKYMHPGSKFCRYCGSQKIEQ